MKARILGVAGTAALAILDNYFSTRESKIRDADFDTKMRILDMAREQR
jgi:hypothetical protein